MNKRTFIISYFIIIILFTGIGLYNLFRYESKINDRVALYKNPNEIDNLNAAENGFNSIIVYFNSSTYDLNAENWFEYYGGRINGNEKWFDLFNEFSGFAGIFPLENISNYKNQFPNVNIEKDEILEVQMNYATVQSSAANSTWSLNGFKGDTNASIAVLDSGVNPDHDFLVGKVSGWKNFVNNDPISDDNGHGTYISSVIAGTGTRSYNTTNPSIINIYGNYSHLNLFDEIYQSQNFSIKLFSLNLSKVDSIFELNSICNFNSIEIDKMWFELYYGSTLVNSTLHLNPFINQKLQYKVEDSGIYDLVLKYHKRSEVIPIFSFNASLSFFPETMIQNFNHFTGIANGTQILSYKIINQSGIGYSSDLISALSEVIQNRNKNHIIAVCLSIGTLGNDYVGINKVIDEVINNNILVVIAAGNYGIKGSSPLNKLSMNKNSIVVGSINDIDQIASYSSMGEQIGGGVSKPDIVAPGGSLNLGHRSIISADYKSDEVTTLHGSSISAAIVSAAMNLLIEAKWGDWDGWNAQDLSKWSKILKAILLMTASETNLERENDPQTDIDESDFSPSIFNGFASSLKDIHEGYGRLNIQAAIDALTRNVEVNTIINDHLVSSSINPLGKHVFARKIHLVANTQYEFNLSNINQDSDFDMFLFSNESNQYGEPILLESTQKFFGDFDTFYYTPQENETECILVVKAIEGSSNFNLTVSVVNNYYIPELRTPEIRYIGGTKNSTIISLQEYFGNNPLKNYSIDRYWFYIDYFDADVSNVPPQEVLVHIIETSKNYSLSQLFPPDNNYTDGAQFRSNLIEFLKPGEYHYYFTASDGAHNVRFPISNTFMIKIEFPTDSKSFPYNHNFNDGFASWYYNGTGWGLLNQINSIDNRSGVYDNNWSSLYFGREHSYPSNYTYQPYSIEDSYPNGTLFSPLFNFTGINKNTTHPFAKIGLRTSINTGDFIYLQINLNWTGWITLKTYTNEQREWFMESINLTQYIGYYIQFRFIANLDNNFDPVNYKGLMLDYFALENYSNHHIPQIFFNLDKDITSYDNSLYSRYKFSCDYYDSDGNYPEFVYLEINGNNYSMNNIFGNWNVSSIEPNNKGVTFFRSLVIHEFTNQTFRFHIYDGKYLNTTEWFNQNENLFPISNPNTLQFNTYLNSTLVGYHFANYLSQEFYVAGTPIPEEQTIWLGGENSWHTISEYKKTYIYGGLGQSYGGIYQGYQEEWNSKLITRPIQLKSDHKVYLQYYYDISLQNEYSLEDNELDYCRVSISLDFGKNWEILKEYLYYDENLSGNESIDLSKYENKIAMIMFTLYSNDNTPLLGLGSGWILSDIYVGFDKNTDFINPEVQIIKPLNDELINSGIKIEALITDNRNIDTSRIYLYLNDKLVASQNYNYNTETGILTYLWDTTYSTDGSYEVKVVAFDGEGNRGEHQIMVVVENGFINWHTWGPWIVVIFGAVVIVIVLYIIAEKKGKIWIKRTRNNNAENLRLKDIDKDQVIKRIELIESEYKQDRPLTLYCKYCGSWFESKKFDYICPVCEHDTIYAAYNCLNCKKWYFKDEPGDNYYCKKCKGVKLIRREKEEVKDILAEKGYLLRKFEYKDKKFSILD